MTVSAVIPARWGSTRLEGKVLLDIAGKPMIRHVWERVQASRLFDHVIIATDDERILKSCRQFGGEVVMTSDKHQSGTDRIAEAVKDLAADVIVNVQADEPLIDSSVLSALIEEMNHDPQLNMATVMKEIATLDELKDPDCVKVVCDRQRNAMYFSRASIPFVREKGLMKHFKHIGIYAYRKSFLLEYARMEPSLLERTEKLEQLRVLEAGYSIRLVETERDMVGVDTFEDLEKIRQRLVKNEKN